MKNTTFKKFDPMTSSEVEWKQYHEFRRLKNKEANPDDPISSDESIEKSIKANLQTPEAEINLTNIIDNKSSKVIGDIMYAVITEQSPSYEGTKHLVQFDIYILKEYRQQGIGKQALKLVFDFATERKKTLLMTGSDNDDGRSFLEQVGAQVALAGAENRLRFSEVDWDMVSEWAQEGQKRSPDTKIEVYTKIPDEIMEPFCNILTEVVNQQPLGSLDMGAIVITPESLRDQDKMIEAMGRKEIHMITREPNGEISGLTQMRYNPEREIMISQLMTGVQENHRGRGLGKWLKASMLLNVRKELPKVEIITTGNATTNAPMISINDRLGFKKHKESVNAQITTESLAKYFN